LDGRLADGLSQVTFPRPAWTQEKCVFPLADEGTSCQIEYQAAIHLRVEGEVEVVQSLVRVPEGGLFAPPIQQSLTAAGTFRPRRTASCRPACSSHEHHVGIHLRRERDRLALAQVELPKNQATL